MVDRPQSGEGWVAVNNEEVIVDGATYKGYSKGGSFGRDMFIKVGEKELCFIDNTPWNYVVKYIRLAVDEQATRIYIARVNSDSTEGRGPMVPVGYWSDPDKAVESIRGRGVMGVGDGEVVVAILDSGKATTELFYGYRRNLVGKYGYGYADNRDDDVLRNDPEFAEYTRLKEKFEK